jgi:hypothetical protein
MAERGCSITLPIICRPEPKLQKGKEVTLYNLFKIGHCTHFLLVIAFSFLIASMT